MNKGRKNEDKERDFRCKIFLLFPIFESLKKDQIVKCGKRRGELGGKIYIDYSSIDG